MTNGLLFILLTVSLFDYVVPQCTASIRLLIFIVRNKIIAINSSP